MKTGLNRGKKYKPYKRLTNEQKELIYKLYEEKMELRKIARTLGIRLYTVQYHIKKNYKNLKSSIRSK